MISDTDRARRRRFLGASDVPVVLGLSPYSEPWDIWDAKVNGTYREAGEAAKWGNRLEDDIIDALAERLDGPPESSVCSLDKFGEPKLGVFGANFDALGVYKGNPVILEAKTTGITGEVDATWGDAKAAYSPDSPNLPIHVAYQCQALLLVAGLRYQQVLVGCLRGGRGFAVYRVPRIQSMIDRIVQICVPWWRRHVVGGVEPVRHKQPKESQNGDRQSTAPAAADAVDPGAGGPIAADPLPNGNR